MIQLRASQVSPQLRTLFKTDDPQAARCFAVLDGVQTGTIIADDPLHPAWAVVQEPWDRTVYLGGQLSRAIVAEVLTYLRQQGQVLIGLWHHDPRLELLPRQADYDGLTLEFYKRSSETLLETFFSSLPENYSLVQTRFC